jgi:hypothetical protein
MAGKTAEQRAWDLLVYLPAGALLELGDEVGALVEKGRRRYEGQVQSAKLIGQLAVSMGSREAKRRLDKVRQQGAKAVSEAVEPLSNQVSWLMGLIGATKGAPTSDAAMDGSVESHHSATNEAISEMASQEGRGPETESGQMTSRVQDRAEAALVDGADSGHLAGRPLLPIPDYDLLAASQVVRRLEALSSKEREEIRRYESQGRARRTILNRLDQLDRELSGAARPSSATAAKPVPRTSKRSRASRPANGARRSRGGERS